MSASPDSQPGASSGVEHVDEEQKARVPLAIEDWLTVIVMALLALITFANVIARYFTNQSFAWTEEFSIFLMIVLALVASSAAVARHRHIRIEFLADAGSSRRRHQLALWGAVAMVVMFVVMAVLSGRMAWDHYIYEEISPGLGLPQWWYSVWLPLLSLGIALRALGRLVRLWREGRPL